MPRDLNPTQRRHLREIATGASEQTLVDEYAQALKLRDVCAALIQKEGATVRTERGAMKLHPASQMLQNCNNQMLRLRALIDKTRDATPSAPGAGGRRPRGESSAYENRVREYLLDPEMEDMIDDMGMDPPGDDSWRRDPRVVERREQLARQQRVQ